MLRAVVTGVAGQDGSYLSELLLEKGYEVYGISRRKSVDQGLQNIYHILNNKNFNLIEGDLSDPVLMSRIIHNIRPHEFYNIGAASNVGYSFKNPIVISSNKEINKNIGNDKMGTEKAEKIIDTSNNDSKKTMPLISKENLDELCAGVDFNFDDAFADDNFL